MKKDLVTHFSFMISLFVLIIIYKQWFDLVYLPFIFGGILGTLLPDVDYLIYSYFLYPHDESSKQVMELVEDRKIKRTWNYIVKHRNSAKDLLFHTSLFQIIFAVFALVVITSSGSLLGFGLVLAFMLHLFVDQLVDQVENKSMESWYVRFPINLDKLQKKWYLVLNGLVILIFGFFLF